MTSDLERLTRALCIAMRENPDDLVPYGHDAIHSYAEGECVPDIALIGPRWNLRIKAVRALLSELRNPSEGMRIRMLNAPLPMKPGDPPLYEAIWHEGIDHILAEGV